jgi:hypothetical protein
MVKTAMEKRYWNLYTQVVFSCHYFRLYEGLSRHWNTGIQIFLTLVSLSSIASWAIWQQAPLLWSLIIAASQIGTILNQNFRFSRREIVAEFMLPEYESIQNEMEHNWYQVNEVLDDGKINNLIHKYQLEISNPEVKYGTRALFLWKNRLKKKADKLTIAQFEQKFDVREECTK